jgi:lon-related putative ATP-dependent protease
MQTPLDASQLRRRCDPDEFTFETTAELETLDGSIGQSRALGALEFAMRMSGEGYNTYVLGRSGSHKHRLVQDYLDSESGNRPPASDWCYINNFRDTRKPIALALPAGRGAKLRDDMANLVAELREAIPASFESEHYRNRVAEINQEFEERLKAALDELQEQAQAEDLSLVHTPHGFAIAPAREGKLMADDEFDKLPDDEKKKMVEAIDKMSERLRKHIREVPGWQRTHRERIKALDREFTNMAVGQLIDQLDGAYKEFPKVIEYLRAVREDVLANAADFQSSREDQAVSAASGGGPALNRYSVNVIVDRSEQSRAPIVYENNPSVQNLLGIVEYEQRLGALVTDFTEIRPGALHAANGGYLVLDADRVLTAPYSWSALKRTLFSKAVKIESLGQMLSIVSTVSLEPAPIPLDVKVVLIGDRRVYYLLCEFDPDFAELFKVAADFEDRIDRNTTNTASYARLLATLAKRAKLLPVSKHAVARIVDHSARLVADSEKLTTRIRDLSDLLREANYWAVQEARDVIDAAQVQKAIDAQIGRLDRIRSLVHEGVQRNDILIDTSGSVTGQVNGLSVLSLGSFMFGQPSRITATVRIGAGKVIDIERETELGGPIHAKGVLIVSSYLASRYAQDVPLSFHASLVFEQSYAGVEGDSASVAETCALLSVLADLPIRQCLAVTGSVNQHGVVQVIGGVNEKIEGFFDICSARGLTGDAGVLIPKDNVKHLMLRQDVVDAVAAKQFNIFAIERIDDAIELLTGVSAGQRDSAGAFRADSVNGRVDARLRALARARRAFGDTKNGGSAGEIGTAPGGAKE